MTQNIESMIEVLQAYQAGKKVEFRNAKHYPEWTACDATGPAWNFHESEYRIAPEPRKKVKLGAWLRPAGQLEWYDISKVNVFADDWIRVPSEDKEILL